jgi:hypothetical protein
MVRINIAHGLPSKMGIQAAWNKHGGMGRVRGQGNTNDAQDTFEMKIASLKFHMDSLREKITQFTVAAGQAKHTSRETQQQIVQQFEAEAQRLKKEADRCRDEVQKAWLSLEAEEQRRKAVEEAKVNQAEMARLKVEEEARQSRGVPRAAREEAKRERTKAAELQADLEFAEKKRELAEKKRNMLVVALAATVAGIVMRVCVWHCVGRRFDNAGIAG